MRSLIFVRAERTKLDEYDERVDAIRDAFDRYLDKYHVKTYQTKTGLMGPVGKILSEALTGKWDAESLTGYALNIHLMNPNSRGYIDASARQALEDGVKSLMALIGSAPASAHDKLLARIDYGLYWIRRKKNMEFRERTAAEYQKFISDLYGDIETLNNTWGLTKQNQITGFSRIPCPGRKGKRYKEAGTQERADMEQFLKSRKEISEALNDEGEDEE